MTSTNQTDDRMPDDRKEKGATTMALEFEPIQAKYSGRCSRCRRNYPVGTKIMRRKDFDGWTHADCDDGSNDSAPIEHGSPSGQRAVGKAVCAACGNFEATVDLVIRSTGRVQASVCPQCALRAMQDDPATLDKHAAAFGWNTLTRWKE